MCTAFAAAESFVTLLTLDQRVPVVSFIFSCQSFRAIKRLQQQDILFDSFAFKYVERSVTRMPAPFDTHCHPDFPFRDCHRDCYAASAKRVADDRVHFMTAFFEDQSSRPSVSSKRIVGPQDLQTHARMLAADKAACHRKCWRSPCSFAFTTTITDRLELIQKRVGERMQSFRIVAHSPASPGVAFKTDAAFALEEFAICCASCAGFWFGFSALILHPTRVADCLRTLVAVVRRHRLRRWTQRREQQQASPCNVVQSLDQSGNTHVLA